jgi:hypothetical protein
MNSIDIKSLLIGALLTSTVIFGVASTSNQNAPAQGKTGWDKDQVWEVKWQQMTSNIYKEAMIVEKGWEPYGREKGMFELRRRVQ